MSQDPSKILLFEENYGVRLKTFNSFFVRFSEENDPCQKAKIFHSFIQSYQSTTQNLSTEIMFSSFPELLSKVYSLCEAFLKPGDLSSSPKGNVNLEKKIQNIESACLCVDAIYKLLESSSQKGIHPRIFKVALNVLCLGYTHCQDSEMIYGELLEQLESQLGLFFKKIESLQIIALEKLDIYSASILSVEDDPVLKSLLHELGNVCQTVSNIHASAAYDLWTCYIQVLSKHTHLQNLDISSALECLVSQNLEILQSSKYNLITETEEDEETSTNFCFYLKTLVDVLKISESKSEKIVLELKIFISNLFEYLILCFSPIILDKSNLGGIKNCLIKNTYSVVTNFYKNKDDLEKKLNQNEQQLNTTEFKESQIGSLLQHLCITQFMECLPVQLKEQMFFDILLCLNTKTLENDVDLLYAKVPQCTVIETNSDELVSLYEFAYGQICEFLKTFPSTLIKKMNNTVLLQFEKCSDVGFLLMSDVWVYRLRCSSVDFLKDICFSALKDYPTSNTHVNIENFLTRVLNFLPNSYKKWLAKEFPTLQFLHDGDTIQHRYGTPDLSSSDYDLSTNCYQNMKEMMSSLNECDTSDVLQLMQKACSWLELCAVFVKVSDTSEVFQFVNFAGRMFKTGIYEIQIAVLTFIKALSRKQLQEHSQEFGKILSNMAELFYLAIHSKNYGVQLEALNTFNYFANRTPHIRIVQDTLKRDPSLKPLLKHYITLSPDETFLTEKEKMEQLHRRLPELSVDSFEISQHSKQALLEIFSKV